MKFPVSVTTLFFPSRCVVCDKVTSHGRMICGNCEKYLVHPAEKRRRCDICFLPPEICGCGKNRYYEKLSAPFLSVSPALRSVYKMKFDGKLYRIKPFAHFMKLALDERGLTEQIDVISFIPMHRSGQTKRGYNQAEELAKALSKETGIECVPLLHKCVKTPPQHTMKTSAMRTGNLLGAYEPIHENTELFKDKTVLLTDDIITSGSTLNEAAKTLLIFGADKVFVTAAVSTPKKQHKTADK